MQSAVAIARVKPTPARDHSGRTSGSIVHCSTGGVEHVTRERFVGTHRADVHQAVGVDDVHRFAGAIAQIVFAAIRIDEADVERRNGKWERYRGQTFCLRVGRSTRSLTRRDGSGGHGGQPTRGGDERGLHGGFAAEGVDDFLRAEEQREVVVDPLSAEDADGMAVGEEARLLVVEELVGQRLALRRRVPSMGRILLDERSQSEPMTATVAEPQGVAAR